MDEILLHISQRLESLQVFISSSLQNSRVSLQSYSEQLNTISIRSRNVLGNCIQNLNSLALSSRTALASYADSAWGRIGPQFADAQEKLLLIIQWLRDLCLRAWQSLQEHTAVVRTALADGSVAVMPRTPIQIGSIGFALGSVVGLAFGLSWQSRPLPPAVCMKAVVATSLRGIDGLAFVEDVGSPIIIQPDEVLVEVIASSVDPVDVAICGGYARSLRHQLGVAHAPVLLGRDCAGIVVEVGRSVAWLARGDEVWLALPPWRQGAMAQLVVAREQQISLKPKALSFEAAASVPYAALQAWHAAVTQAKLGAETAPGKRVLVRDAGSAVGCVLVQLARLWGAHVTAVVSTRGKEVARQIGAHDVIVASIDLDMELRSRPRYDVVFNTLGPAVDAGCRRACDPDGQVVSTASPVLPADSYGLLLSSTHTLWVKAKCLLKGPGVVTRAWGSVAQGRTVLEQVGRLVEQGQLQPVLDRVFSATDAELAFQHATSSNAVGKTVVHFRSLGRGRSNYIT